MWETINTWLQREQALEKVQSIIQSIQKFKEEIEEILELSKSILEIQKNPYLRSQIDDTKFDNTCKRIEKIEKFEKNFDGKDNAALQIAHQKLIDSVWRKIKNIEKIGKINGNIWSSEIEQLKKHLSSCVWIEIVSTSKAEKFPQEYSEIKTPLNLKEIEDIINSQISSAQIESEKITKIYDFIKNATGIKDEAIIAKLIPAILWNSKNSTMILDQSWIKIEEVEECWIKTREVQTSPKKIINKPKKEEKLNKKTGDNNEQKQAHKRKLSYIQKCCLKVQSYINSLKNIVWESKPGSKNTLKHHPDVDGELKKNADEIFKCFKNKKFRYRVVNGVLSIEGKNKADALHYLYSIGKLNMRQDKTEKIYTKK